MTTETCYEAQYEEAVARGVALLDEYEPDWAQRVDPNNLSMGLCLGCVLGQISRSKRDNGDYGNGLEELHKQAQADAGKTHTFACRNGFYLPDADQRNADAFVMTSKDAERWKRLGELWRQEIVKRRKEAE